jgi:hypothetical protein
LLISKKQILIFLVQEFQLQQMSKTTLIIQLWNEQYQEFIDIESFKQIPFEGRLQVLMYVSFYCNVRFSLIQTWKLMNNEKLKDTA